MTKKLVAPAIVLATDALVTTRNYEDGPDDLDGPSLRVGGRLTAPEAGIERLTRPVDETDHVLGPEDAPVTLVVYGDYLCPRTRSAWPVVNELVEELEDRLRLAFRHFPGAGESSDVPAVAEAAEAAAAQGRFWEMHGALFRASKVIEGPFDGPLLARYAAAKVGLDRRRIERQVERRVHAGKVREDVEGGLESGVRETPAFFVNGTRHDDTYLIRVLLSAPQESTIR